MSCKKTFLFLTLPLISGVLSLYAAGFIFAGQTLSPELKGKDPLPGSFSGPGIEALDAFDNAPVEEDIKPGETMQGMLLQAIGMDDLKEVRYLTKRAQTSTSLFQKKGTPP